MHFRDDEELFSIGAVAIADVSGAYDNTSDASDWVLQYGEWEECAVQFEFTPWSDFASRVGPIFQASLPGPMISVPPHCHVVFAQQGCS